MLVQHTLVHVVLDSFTSNYALLTLLSTCLACGALHYMCTLFGSVELLPVAFGILLHFFVDHILCILCFKSGLSLRFLLGGTILSLMLKHQLALLPTPFEWLD